MGQLHLYVEKEIEEEIRKTAQRKGISVSRYLTEVVIHYMKSQGWQPGFFKEVTGGWKGSLPKRFPFRKKER
jgi:hypothetical protein